MEGTTSVGRAEFVGRPIESRNELGLSSQLLLTVVQALSKAVVSLGDDSNGVKNQRVKQCSQRRRRFRIFIRIEFRKLILRVRSELGGPCRANWQIVSEYSDVQFLKENDLSLCLEQLTAELKTTEAENGDLCNEIEELKQTHMASKGELESLNYALDNFKRLDHKEVRERASVDGSNDGGTCSFSKEHEEQSFQELDLDYQIERSSATLKELQDLDHMLKKYEAIKKIEELFSGLKAIEFEGKHIRLSLKTYIPYVEGLMHHQKLRDTVETSDLNHELQIEVKSGSMELKNVEIFPNDVHIGDIFEVITSFRHSLEYSDRDELIMASIRGIDAFIKPSQGWPLSTSVLKLISLKPSDHDALEISLCLLCEIELANSLEFNIRRNITSFIDAIEEIIAQKLRQELHANHVAK